jgi:hypothetical protein
LKIIHFEELLNKNTTISTKTRAIMNLDKNEQFLKNSEESDESEKYEELLKAKALALFRNEFGFEVYTLLQIKNLIKLEFYKDFAYHFECLEEEAKKELRAYQDNLNKREDYISEHYDPYDPATFNDEFGRQMREYKAGCVEAFKLRRHKVLNYQDILDLMNKDENRTNAVFIEYCRALFDSERIKIYPDDLKNFDRYRKTILVRNNCVGEFIRMFTNTNTVIQSYQDILELINDSNEVMKEYYNSVIDSERMKIFPEYIPGDSSKYIPKDDSKYIPKDDSYY